jgi:hypothetical protein
MHQFFTRLSLWVMFAAALALGARHASAHHSFAATYLQDRTVTIEGELAQLLFRHPHSLLHVIVKERSGREVRYAVEWDSSDRLEGQGLTKETLRVGDHVVITGSPARNDKDHRVRMTTLRRPRDNFNYDPKTRSTFH